MKTESTVKYVLRIALTLLAITAVVAVILAAANSVTAPRIAAQNEQKTQAAIEAVLPGGGQEVTFTDDTGLVTAAYKGVGGCAIQVTPAGFNGTVTMMVGVDNDGKVTGISIISHSETAGLGATAAAGRGQSLPRPVCRHERHRVRHQGRRRSRRPHRRHHHVPGSLHRRQRRAGLRRRSGLRRLCHGFQKAI